MHLHKEAMALIAVASVLAPQAAAAQESRAVDAVRQCRTIADTAARVACYDRIDVGSPAIAAAAPAAAATPISPPREGLGANQLPPAPQPRPAEPRTSEPARIEAGVATVVEREPGVLLLTLADGTQWLTVDTVTQTYNRPRRGATVEIVSAAMDSYQLRYGNQRALRVRRVR